MFFLDTPYSNLNSTLTSNYSDHFLIFIIHVSFFDLDLKETEDHPAFPER